MQPEPEGVNNLAGQPMQHRLSKCSTINNQRPPPMRSALSRTSTRGPCKRQANHRFDKHSGPKSSPAAKSSYNCKSAMGNIMFDAIEEYQLVDCPPLTVFNSGMALDTGDLYTSSGREPLRTWASFEKSCTLKLWMVGATSWSSNLAQARDWDTNLFGDFSAAPFMYVKASSQNC